MAEKSLIELLSDMEEIQFLMHCAIESVRQSWVALTQGVDMPTEADYDALWGTYHRLSQLDAAFLQNKEAQRATPGGFPAFFLCPVAVFEFNNNSTSLQKVQLFYLTIYNAGIKKHSNINTLRDIASR